MAKFKESTKNKWLGQVLHVDTAGEPSEILWKNQAITNPVKWTHRVITFLGTLLLLVGSFYILLHLHLVHV